MKHKVLVLGADGMLGRIVYRYLKNQNDLTCFGTSRKILKGLIVFDASKLTSGYKTLINRTGNVDFVINCIALLKSYPDGRKISKTDYYNINTRLPLFLEKRSQLDNFRLIHFSTDSVYSRNSHRNIETSKISATDEYSRSKLKGEASGINSLTLRTSILGFDPLNKKGLIEFVHNVNNIINGYNDQIWSGATVLQIAKLVFWLIKRNGFNKIAKRTHILNFAPLKPLTKYKLLWSISSVYGYEKKIKKSLSNNPITRYLASEYTYLLPIYLNGNNIVHELKLLRQFENKYF